ncbi:TetR/AcrR family transcriptional regulator [Aquipuribacter sp. MA13-13]
MAREPLTTGRIVATSRSLLVEGGPDAVVVREVARRLGVTAPALYRHVSGRDDLLTLLIAACQDEVADVCQAAVDAGDPTDHDARLRRATWAFRTWALANTPEFGLVYGTPIVGYEAPEGGPTVVSGRRFGQLFGGLFVDLLRAGRLRTLPDSDLAPSLRADLQQAADAMGLPMRPGEVYPFVMGFQRMLGIVSVEVSGHLRWAFTDSEAFTRRQLDDLAADLERPGSTPTGPTPAG